MDGGMWWAAVHGVEKSRTRVSNFTFTFHFHALEKEMATHSSVLAWRIPGMEEPGGVAQSRTPLKQLSSSSSSSSYNPQNSLLGYALILSSFDWSTWGTKRLNNLPKDTQILNSRSKIWAWTFWLRSLHSVSAILNHCTTREDFIYLLI